MDNSEKYIKMCDCPEIQRHRISYGDYYAVPETQWELVDADTRKRKEGYRVELDTIKSDPFYVTVESQRRIWIPRQDQLQMLSGLDWKEFDKECLKYDAATKEQAGIQVVREMKKNTVQ